MPQPFLKVKPGAELKWDSESNPSIRRPELALLAMSVISNWANLEVALGGLFVELLGANPRPGAAMYASLTSTAAQKASLRAVAELVLDDTDLSSILQAILFYFARVAKMRNKVAHWAWAYSPESPDAVVLINPNGFIQHKLGKDLRSELAHRIRQERTEMRRNGIEPKPALHENAWLWNARDFLRLSAEIRELTMDVNLFVQVLIFKDSTNIMSKYRAIVNGQPADQQYRQALDRLKTRPQIAKFLSRPPKDRKSSQEEP